ncbi:putative amidohydrolase YtcJ [Streptosporangium album]|uniref:Putative amidohydrolase YtcJ n=1 Tax=Streptosporangium album TaxID=47479 RepID=A0A7W7RRD1_9ACTN|nr:amidohydrolase family protein [Streptosporangium album]MBB4936472.1 putative amidohydrolase YtcJ [Streptosporangium album]
MPDGDFDARRLDEAARDRPVVLRAYDHHTVWCNTAALARAGIGPGTPDPRIGRIVRREDGSPLGTPRAECRPSAPTSVMPRSHCGTPTADTRSELLSRAVERAGDSRAALSSVPRPCRRGVEVLLGGNGPAERC